VYANNSTFFEVVAIKSQGSGGGKFTVRRIRGKVDPGLHWVLVEGSGPESITGYQTLLDLYLAGGMFMHPIALLGLGTMIMLFNCIWIYRRKRQCPTQFAEAAEQLLDKGDLEQFEALAMKEKGMLASICRALTDRFTSSTPEDIKNRCEIAAGVQINRLRIPVKALNLAAGAAPLLGLLGTIVGMVIVFEAVAGETGAAKAQALASGIRVKLFCTAGALCVARTSPVQLLLLQPEAGLADRRVRDAHGRFPAQAAAVETALAR